MRAMGSKSPAFTSPALATTIEGAPSSSLRARSKASTSSRPASSRAKVSARARPMPSMARALVALGWM